MLQENPATGVKDVMPPPSQSGPFRFNTIFILAIALTVVAGIWMASYRQDTGMKPAPEGVAGGATTQKSPTVSSVGGVPLFATWPKDQKPDMVLVLTGQTFGYMSPCGCSKPQKGGLERRANFIDSLRAKDWPVVPLDLGDISAPRKITSQDWLKYEYTMKSLAEMGYGAVGLGEFDFNQQLWQLLSRYSLQNADAPPIVLAANLAGNDDKGGIIARDKLFAGAGKRPLVEAIEVVSKTKGVDHVAVGITSVIGPSVFEKVKKIDPSFAFLESGDVLKISVAALKAHVRKPPINVLLYAGNKDEAMKAASAFPELNVVVCQIEESEPPQFPTVVNNGKTFIIQVGHKGQNVGVIGVFKTETGYDLKYQLVPLGEEFLTPDGEEAEKNSKQLQLLEEYTGRVKKENLLALFTEKPLMHSAQIQNPGANLTFIGSDKCQSCHPNEYKVWKDSKHSHAMEALEKYAKRPGNRQFDGECVVCHTVGFGYKSGYTNEESTKHLRHVGCESCHGPGSGHAGLPNDKTFLAAMSSWKTKPTDVLPDKDTIVKLAAVKLGEPAPVQLTAKQQHTATAISSMCMKCHDPENDPKFDLYKYMPQMWHSGFKPATNAGLPPNAK